MMNVLLVVTGLPDAKTPARSVFNLNFANELSFRGNKVTIVYIRSITPKRQLVNWKKIGELECLEVSTIFPKIGFITKPIFNSMLFKFLIKRKFENIDIVHAIGGNAVEAAYLISQIYKKPLISQFIGSDINNNLEYLMSRRDFLKGIKKSSILSFNSQGLLKVFNAKIPHFHNTQVIYRGVKLGEFKPKFEIESHINILFLGGFVGENRNLKGGITLLQAIQLLNVREVFTNLSFLIGGPNSTEYAKEIKLINPKVQISVIGAVNKDKVKMYMQNSHIVVIPSLAEGLPNVLYEAMATGNMVIATDVGGISEILIDNKTGKLIPPNNALALAECIDEITKDITKIENAASLGRKRIESFDYSSFVDKYIEIYNLALLEK